MFAFVTASAEEEPVVIILDERDVLKLDEPARPEEERSFAHVLVDLLFPFNPLFDETFDQLVIVACALDDRAAAELEASFWSL